MIPFDDGLNMPIRSVASSVNQMLPTLSTAIPAGEAFGVGTGYSVMACVKVLMLAILLAPASVNHSRPLVPAVMPSGLLLADGMA